MMDGRQSLINALITLVAVAILALVASVFKFRAGGGLLGNPRPNPVTEVAKPELLVQEEITGNAVREELPAIQLGSYQILTNCHLIEDGGNDGSSFRVYQAGREFVIHLYYAQAPGVGGSAPDSGAYPGGVVPSFSGTTLHKAEDDSRDFALSFIRDRTFRMFTRWERVGNKEDHIYGFVVVHAAGKGRFLSELLVANGFASIMNKSVPLPDGQTTSDDYLNRLSSLAQAARSSSRGLWGMLQPAVVEPAAQTGAYVPAG